MAELQEQLQAILGDPETMGQITAIARALTGGSTEPAAPSGEKYVPVDGQPQNTPTAQPDLSALLGSGLSDIDPKLLQIALRVFSEYSAQDDEKAALLSALKPFLRPERQEKLERAVKIARLSRVVRTAVELLKEEGGHV